MGKARSRGVGGHSSCSASAVRSSSSSGIRRLLDPGPQPGERPRQSRLDRAFRNAERGGRLLTVQLEEVAARDHEAVLLAERVHHREQTAALVARNGYRLGGWGRIPRAEALREAKLELMPPSRRPNAIASLVGHDPQQPWPEVSV